MIRCLPVLLLLGAAGATAQQPKAAPQKATARDMYFAGLEGLNEKKSPSPQTKGSKKAGPAASAKVKKSEPVAVADPTPPSRVDIPVRTVSGRPLGIRASVLKVDGPEVTEVPAQTRFRSGDRIRLKVQPNDNGYLYIAHQGTSGDWQFIFPTPKRQGGSNRVDAGVEYILPPNSSMVFSGKPGIEKLFVILTRMPEKDLDGIIYSLQRSSPGGGGGAQQGQMMLAENRIVGNPLIDQMRKSFSRDLVIQESDEEPETPSGKRDTAIYVVNPKGTLDSRVVLDIQLVHQ